MNTIHTEETGFKGLPRWMEEFGWLLAASFLLIQPFHKTFELSMAMMAFSGLWLALRWRRTVPAIPALGPFLLVFACIFLPMLTSLTDAVYFPRAAETTLAFLRFPFAAVFVLLVLGTPVARSRMLMATGLWLSLAALGVVIMTVTGHTMNGHVEIRFPIGHILGVLSPIYFYWLSRMGQKQLWIWLAGIIYTAAIIFSGARVAWIMMAVGIVLFLVQMYCEAKIQLSWKNAGIGLIFLSVLGLGVTEFDPGVKANMVKTAGLFSGNYEKANAATSLRLHIWEVAIKVAKDHWINGVGPRGFRYIYPAYVPKDDFWMVQTYVDKKTGKTMTSQTGPNHPHQLLLEILVETGGIGLLGYLVALTYWIRLWWKNTRSGGSNAAPWMAAGLVAIMPINAHMAFYASFWSCMTWWLMAVSLAYWQVNWRK